MSTGVAEGAAVGAAVAGPQQDGAVRAATLPVAEDVGVLLNGLFDRAVTARDESRLALAGRDVHMVGAYVEDDGRLRAAILCDLMLGVVLGAALALVPVPRVQDALETGSVPPDFADNTREVLNIAASLFNSADAHLKLRDVQVAPEPVSDDVVAFLRSQPYRADVTLEVPGYGTGVLAVLLTV